MEKISNKIGIIIYTLFLIVSIADHNVLAISGFLCSIILALALIIKSE